MELRTEDKAILLKAARDSIKSVFDESEVPPPDFQKYPSLKNTGRVLLLPLLLKRTFADV